MAVPHKLIASQDAVSQQTSVKGVWRRLSKANEVSTLKAHDLVSLPAGHETGAVVVIIHLQPIDQ